MDLYLKNNKTTIIITALILIAAVIWFLSMINANNGVPPVGTIAARPDVHNEKNELTGAKLKEKISKDLLDDIKLMQSKNPHDFTKGLTGRALRQFQTAYEKDFDGGKIRVRVYKTIDVKVIGMQFGVPEAIYKFTDNSYYIDTKTRQPVSQPLNVKREWALGLAKDAGGHWKVSLIMGAARNSKHP
ncbi:MAG: hypothetical protein AUK32_08305 [Candidatus Aquicultor secundus]|uniref:Uncharacterized protein n=1 Tax=Candidatus Aquicultor secundus TaxID=1973895 RepID=A0A2M7TBV5_9ACTN|nr:hypothetical protein [Candidatus Aquicultor secundus]OIO84695.1 MAG: hypothetical protein AUK32_08305 [Candidatus Aquicultor secundus]PIU27946.1 MAG: hypothetical protein COT10_00860 [Candidatus Aquicultor secundus]PIX51585.1 MAG: hypothetical protein COZ51_08875 [Candidatus Aquicultor secundus]PIY41644.1 MAG: hypothetical protein COZ03_01675 [Candidatus Aquicultor secundus]PIZ42704.1 MAG: hypothetical protein COY37_00010 [Candidatus Aquicultor secundus]